MGTVRTTSHESAPPRLRKACSAHHHHCNTSPGNVQHCDSAHLLHSRTTMATADQQPRPHIASQNSNHRLRSTTVREREPSSSRRNTNLLRSHSSILCDATRLPRAPAPTFHNHRSSAPHSTTVIHAEVDRELVPVAPHTNAATTVVRLRPPQRRHAQPREGEECESETLILERESTLPRVRLLLDSETGQLVKLWSKLQKWLNKRGRIGNWTGIKLLIN